MEGWGPPQEEDAMKAPEGIPEQRDMEGWDPLWWTVGDIGDKERPTYVFTTNYHQKYYFRRKYNTQCDKIV